MTYIMVSLMLKKNAFEISGKELKTHIVDLVSYLIDSMKEYYFFKFDSLHKFKKKMLQIDQAFWI
jgi:hypothetical protein